MKHDFYADPTVFDQWHESAGRWFCTRFEKFCPYLWVAGFCALAVLSILVAVLLLGMIVHGGFLADQPVSWNLSLARSVTAMVALLAAQTQLQQAMRAWPEGQDVPRRFYVAARLVGAQKTACPPSASPREDRVERPTAATDSRADRQAVQAFFAGVRAAGVNVAIARSLFDAGVRSIDQFRALPDSTLLNIRGVGAATVHKLRVHFGAA